MTVTAEHPFQIAYAGTIAAPGESLTVPPELAAKWAGMGLARLDRSDQSEVKVKAAKQTAPRAPRTAAT